MAWPAALVRVMWQGTCAVVIAAVRAENGSGGSSPGWTSRPDQSIEAPSSRGGVPVLRRREDEARGVQAAREVDRRRVADAAGRGALVAEMNDAAQERAGGDDDGAAGKGASVGELDAGDRAALENEAARFALDDRQAGGLSDQALHRQAVELAVRLGARTLNGGALAAIEDPELNPGGVGGARHQPVEGVDFAHEVALAEAADRGVAGHHADGVALLRHQRGARAEARRRRRGFAAGVAAADHDDVIKAHSRRLDCFT